MNPLFGFIIGLPFRCFLARLGVALVLRCRGKKNKNRDVNA
jgi:hypothetical protein